MVTRSQEKKPGDLLHGRYDSFVVETDVKLLWVAIRVLIREGAETSVALRRKHPAVESVINALGHRGLDRVRGHGAGGFERVVGLSVLAFNIHRLSLLGRRQRMPLAA